MAAEASGTPRRAPERQTDGELQSEGTDASRCCSKVEPPRPHVTQSRGGRAVRATSPQHGQTQRMVRIINSLGLI
jgi:hypothetical protein